MNSRNIILSLFALLYSGILSGQPKCQITHYGLADGLPQRSVMDMLQDSKGFMWFATWGGLCKFDGYTFTTYKATPNDAVFMGNNRIDRIKEDGYGQLWTYTNYTKETYRFDPRKEKYVASFFIGDQSFQTAEILTMPSRRVWLTSETMGTICVTDTTNRYSVYSRENELLSSNRVHTVFEDDSLSTWILTDNGITHIRNAGKENEHRETHFATTENAAKSHSFFAAFETDTEIWFGANQGRIACFNKSTQQFELYNTGVESEIITIKRISDKHMIILTSNDGFFICDNNRKHINHYHKHRLKHLPTNEMKSCFVDSRHNIWLELGVHGVARFNMDNNSLTFYLPATYTTADLTAPPHFSILEDKAQRIWVHPRGGGFSFYDPATDRLLPFFNDPSSTEWKFSHQLHDLFMDNRGNLWISTRTEGIEKITFDDETFKISDFAGKVPEMQTEIRALVEDNHQNIWLSSKEGHIMVYDAKKRFKGYLSANGMISKTAPPLKAKAYTIIKDRENNIWVGSKGNGLFWLKGVDGKPDVYTIKNYTRHAEDPYSLNHNSVYAIHEDSKGNIWIGTLGGGVNLFDKVAEQFIHCGNQLTGYPIHIGHQVRNITSADSMVYVATTLGLVCISTAGNKASAYEYNLFSKTENATSGLMANDIYQVYIAHNKKVYIATQGSGLSMVEEFDARGFPKRFKTYDTTNKLTSDAVLSIIEDNEKNVWIVSEANLSVYNTQSGEVEHFPRMARILNTKFFSEAMPLLTHSGELILGCTQGTLSLTPQMMKKDEYRPNLTLTRFSVSGNDLIVKGELNHTEVLNLQPNVHSFSIEFVALDFTDPHSIHYAYKLDGFESEWVYCQKNRRVSYTNIPHGKYTFRVKATNSNGVWSDAERSLNIVIAPSFGHSPWARMLYITLALILMGMAMRIVVNRRKRTHYIAQPSTQIAAEAILIEQEETSHLSTSDQEFLKKITDIIYSNMDNSELVIDDLVAEANISRKLFYNKIKSLTGLAPSEFLREVRMKRAAQLILTENHMIKEIAYMVGFTDVKRFSNSFKQKYGVVPSEYRRGNN